MNSKQTSFWFSSKGVVALCAIAIIAYFLLVEHRHHLTEWSPYLIILLCPLMHLFMHHGHGKHTHHPEPEDDSTASSDEFKRGYQAALRDRDKEEVSKKEEDHA